MFDVHEGAVFGKPLSDMPNLYALCLPCFGYLAWRLGHHSIWAFGMLATWGVLAFFRHIGFDFGNRYTFFVAFFAQFVVAEVMALGIFALLGPMPELRAERQSPGLDRPFLIGVLAVALVAWLPSPMLDQARKPKSQYGTLSTPLALLRQPSPLDEYYAQFAELRAHVSERDLVLFPFVRAAFDLSSITGAKVVSSPNAIKVPDRVARELGVKRFFDARASKEQRARLLSCYRPTKLVLPSDRFNLLAVLSAQFGPPTHQLTTYAVWEWSSWPTGTPPDCRRAT
jgi:hypothetical protein